MQATQNSRGWRLRDVIMLTLIAIFFGFIFWIWAFAYNAIAATPLKPFANDITLGAWVMAGPLAGYLLRKPGAAFLGEFLAAFAEMIIGSQWGVSTLLSGVIQGVANELGFTLTGYKYWNAFSLFLSTLTTTIVTFGYDIYANGYGAFGFGMMLGLFVIRFISVGFFGGILVHAITKLIDKSGIMGR